MTVDQFPNEIDESHPPEHGGELTDARCDEIIALIPAYSLGATDPEESALVRARLAACPEAVHALAEYATLTAALLYSAPPVSPPARLENQVRRAVGQPLARRLSLPATRTPGRRHGWRWTITGLAAAATAILILVGLNFYWIRQNQVLRQAYEQLVSQQQRQEQEEQDMYVLLASAGRQTIDLPAAQENSEANAAVLWDPDVSVAMLYAKAFPPLAPDQVYQLWLTANGQRASGGLFTVDQGGTGVLIFPITEPLDSLDSMGITPEPAGGSPGPTSPPVVRRRFRET
jgi:anti-sigma-K factor RskA